MAVDNIHIDFQIFSASDPKILVVVDVSIWSVIQTKTAIIEILTPNTTKVKTFVYEKNKTNVFNTSILALSQTGDYRDLPDGIYNITVKGSPDTFCKTRDYLKTDKTQAELDKLYISLGFSEGKEIDDKRSEILKIESLIKTAEAFVRRGRTQEGLNFFKRAVNKLKEYNECKNCK